MFQVATKLRRPLGRKMILKKVSKCFSQYQNKISSFNQPVVYDVAVVGGGIIGAAVSREIQKKSSIVTCVLIEKEDALGKHQSSHNSGVVHAGLYYKPGSMKAEMCKKGADEIITYCQENRIPHKIGGKLIVATDFAELDILKALKKRGEQNRVEGLRILYTKKDIMDVEPRCQGLAALWSPNTAIVDYKQVTESLGKDFITFGGDILLNNKVEEILASDDNEHPILIQTQQGTIVKTKYLIICGGLYSDVISEMIDKKPNLAHILVSFKVNYHMIQKDPISTNIYGVPEMQLPFLGVHLSPRLDGSVLLGPTAVPASKIDGYSEGELDWNYIKNTASFPGFLNMTKRHLPNCISQVAKMLYPEAQIKEFRKLADIPVNEIKPGPTAVQAQLINEDGTFTDDFVFEFFRGQGIRQRVINCKFLPSPAATCCLTIAEYVANRLHNSNYYLS